MQIDMPQINKKANWMHKQTSKKNGLIKMVGRVDWKLLLPVMILEGFLLYNDRYMT